MAAIYNVLIHKKIEGLKYLAVVFCLLSGGFLSSVFRNWIGKYYGENNICYIGCLYYIVMEILFFLFYEKRIRYFLKRNFESLKLLAVSDMQMIALICLTNLPFILTQIIVGYCLGTAVAAPDFLSICQNIVNTACLFLLAYGCAVNSGKKGLHFMKAAMVVLVCLFFLTQNINYESAYLFLTEYAAGMIVKSQGVFVVKVWMVFFLAGIVIVSHRHVEIRANRLNGKMRVRNLIGDTLHRFSGFSFYCDGSVWLGKNKDYVLWKIFSTLFLIGGSRLADGAGILAGSYIIGLVSSFYLVELYDYERRFYFIYKMSDYEYHRFLRDFFRGTLGIVGDNILLVLLLQILFSHTVIYFVLGLLFLVGFSFFLCIQYGSAFPDKKNSWNHILLLIKTQIPILNLYIAYKAVKQGRKNWEKL